MYDSWFRRHWKALTIIGVIVLAMVALLWFVVGYYYDTGNVAARAITRKFAVRELFPSPNPLRWTPFAYILLLIAAGAGAFALWAGTGRNRWGEKTLVFTMSSGRRIFGGILVVVCLVNFSAFLTSVTNNDKDGAISFASGTTFVVESPDNLPASLSPLTQGASRNPGNGCLFTTKHDVPSCITQGSYQPNWDSRVASLSGAQIVMSRTSGSVPNTDIMDETLTYLNGSTPAWTTIRNGSGKQPLYGIVSWDGKNAVQTCRFTGDNLLNYAFGGKWGQNLDDTLAAKFPGLLYTHDDMWGMCSGFEREISARKPVIVIPVTEQKPVGHRTTARAAGVLVITGSPSGKPTIEHRRTVKNGDFPGPVYPLSLVAQQRNLLKWAAGRADKNRLHFGYEPSNVAAQNGNDSEYLLRDKGTGRIYWVTPLKPRSTDSQLLVAYSLTPADEAGSGRLNKQLVYVLPDNDKRIVNVDDMEARVSQAIRDKEPGFFTGSTPGKISEFLPIDATKWQAYAEINGRVTARITIPTDARITPTVESLDGSGTTPAPPTVNVCIKPAKDLTSAQLATCIKQFTDELAGRSTK